MDTFFKDHLDRLSRRDFLKCASTGLASLFLLPFYDHWPELTRLEETQSQGRILGNNVGLYAKPSFSSELINLYFEDLVFPITEVTIGDEEPAYNRIWYQLDGKGYTHSGSVQPVDVRTNEPLTSVPKSGVLAEVTVPFTDAAWYLTQPDYIAYRLYYGTTHWLTGLFTDKNGRQVYRVHDDKWLYHYYADATHFHPVTAEDIKPLSPWVPAKKKRIEIIRSQQILIAYEDNEAVFMSKIASGAKFSDGDFTTPAGRYKANRKRPSRHMAAGDRAAPNSYDLPGVPWVSYLTKSGIAIHGTFWHNDFGKTRSHGCINVPSGASKWLYRWTRPVVALEESYVAETEGTVIDVV